MIKAARVITQETLQISRNVLIIIFKRSMNLKMRQFLGNDSTDSSAHDD